MKNTMSAPTMTDGQIENVVSKLRDAMRKHRSEITSIAAQKAIGVENLGMRMFSLFREDTEDGLDSVIRKVYINPNRSHLEAINAIDCVSDVDHEALGTIVRDGSTMVEIVFFRPKKLKDEGVIYNKDIQQEFESLGLEPANPMWVARVNEVYPNFAKDKPNTTHWINFERRWCRISFEFYKGRLYMAISRFDDLVGRDWWFAGVRK